MKKPNRFKTATGAVAAIATSVSYSASNNAYTHVPKAPNPSSYQTAMPIEQKVDILETVDLKIESALSKVETKIATLDGKIDRIIDKLSALPKLSTDVSELKIKSASEWKRLIFQGIAIVAASMGGLAMLMNAYIQGVTASTIAASPLPPAPVSAPIVKPSAPTKVEPVAPVKP